MGVFRTVAVSAALVSLTVFGVFSQEKPAEIWRLELGAGPIWIGNAFQYHENDDNERKKVHGSAVSPLKITPGVGLHRNMSTELTLRLAFNGLYQEYAELPSGAPIPGKVVPTSSHIGSGSPYNETEAGIEIEQQNVAGVLILPLHIGIELPFIRQSAITTGPGFGLTIVSRIPLLIAGETAGNIAAYHWGSGRFLFPELNWMARFHTFDSFTYGIRLRTLYPVANLWAQEDSIAWWDGMKIQLQAILQLPLFHNSPDQD